MKLSKIEIGKMVYFVFLKRIRNKAEHKNAMKKKIVNGLIQNIVGNSVIVLTKTGSIHNRHVNLISGSSSGAKLISKTKYE